jgi:hypothetical protein
MVRRRRPTTRSTRPGGAGVDPLEQEQRRAFEERERREREANEAVLRFRNDMDEATRVLKAWAAEQARSKQAEWHGYDTATGLVEVELGREAITVARARLRAGAPLDQAVAYAIAEVEELVPEVVQNLGLLTEAWVPWSEGSEEQKANRRKRIASLRAKAASTSYPEEAAAFSAKADQLARKYSLDA